MWKEYFKIIKLKPGRVVTALFGELDFSRDDLPLQKVKALYENDFPYLEITELGKQELYGIEPEKIEQEPIIEIPETIAVNQIIEAPKLIKSKKKKKA